MSTFKNAGRNRAVCAGRRRITLIAGKPVTRATTEFLLRSGIILFGSAFFLLLPGIGVPELHADYSALLSTTASLSDTAVRLSSITQQLISISTANYLYGYGDGMLDERGHDLMGLWAFRFHCDSSSASIVYSTPTINSATCDRVLDTVISWISVQSSTGAILAPPPYITSSNVSTGTVGMAYSYQITATGNPTSFNAYGFLNGLALNTATGLISGIPVSSGTFFISLTATNANGTGPVTQLALTVSAAPPPPPPLLGDTTTSLVYYAPLDEGAGSSVKDYSVNANTVSLSGTYTWGVGHSSGAIFFDGVSGMGKAVSTTGLNVSTSVTLSAWVNLNATGSSYRTVLSKGTLGKAGWGLAIINGLLSFTEINVADVTSTTVTIPTGSWQHVAVTWDGPGNTLKFYRNGILAQIFVPGSQVIPPVDSDPFYIGAFAGSPNFAGGIDGIRIYNRVLTDADMAALYAL
jgi:hypothetical protein